MRAALLILSKDLRQHWRDRSMLIFGVLVPLGLAVVFNAIFGGVQEFDAIDVAVVDADGSEVSRAFVDEVLPAIGEELPLTILRMADAGEARAAVESGEVDTAIAIPAGFGEAFQAGQPADVQVLGHSQRTFSTLITAAIADGYATELDAVALSIATALTVGADPATVDDLARAAGTQPPPIRVGGNEAADKQLDPTTYLAAGMAVFFLFFTVQFGVVGYLGEKRDGTLDRILASPNPAYAVRLAKVGTSFVIGLVSTGVLVVATSVILGADWGDPIGVALLVFMGVLGAVSLVAVVTSLAQTPEQAATWQAIFGVSLGMLGGAFFPVDQGSGFLARVALLTPHHWFLRGLGDLRGGGSVLDVVPAAGAMLAFAAVVIATSAVIGRWRRA